MAQTKPPTILYRQDGYVACARTYTSSTLLTLLRQGATLCHPGGGLYGQDITWAQPLTDDWGMLFALADGYADVYFDSRKNQWLVEPISDEEAAAQVKDFCDYYGDAWGQALPPLPLHSTQFVLL